jgi:hypothetical protein
MCLSKAAVTGASEGSRLSICDKAAVLRDMMKEKFYIYLFQDYCLLDVTLQSLIETDQCAEDLLPPPSLYTVPHSTVKM